MSGEKHNTTIHDKLIGFIREHPEGVGSVELAQSILKFKNPEPRTAHVMVKGILHSDRRCRLGEDARWYPQRFEHVQDNEQRLDQIAWRVVSILADEARGGNIPIHISVWSLFDTPAPLASEWMVDPRTLGSEEAQELESGYDMPFSGRDSAMARLAPLLENTAQIFLSGRHQTLIARECLGEGFGLSDDTILIASLVRVAGLSYARPWGLKSCYRAVFGQEPVLGSAFHHGLRLAECAHELLRRLLDQGLTSRSKLEQFEDSQSRIAQWPKALFSLEAISACPHSAGVYGFKGEDGAYLYVGKAKNLRRRLRTYFRDTEEAGSKLERLRREAKELTVHECGSELESIILEYRLIRKHNPPLNTQVSVGERKGQYRHVPDSIILLSHSNKAKGMSVWLRGGQRCMLMPFDRDFSNELMLIRELRAFFFVPKLEPRSTDFAEMEIVHRWVGRHQDLLSIVPVSRLASAEEAVEWMKSNWAEAMDSRVGFRDEV